MRYHFLPAVGGRGRGSGGTHVLHVQNASEYDLVSMPEAPSPILSNIMQLTAAKVLYETLGGTGEAWCHSAAVMATGWSQGQHASWLVCSVAPASLTTMNALKHWQA